MGDGVGGEGGGGEVSKRKFHCYLFRGEVIPTPRGARPIVAEAKVYVSPSVDGAGFQASATHRTRGEIGYAVGADDASVVKLLLDSLRGDGWRESMTEAGSDARTRAGKRSAQAFIERGGGA